MAGCFDSAKGTRINLSIAIRRATASAPSCNMLALVAPEYKVVIVIYSANIPAFAFSILTATWTARPVDRILSLPMSFAHIALLPLSTAKTQSFLRRGIIEQKGSFVQLLRGADQFSAFRFWCSQLRQI